MTVDTELILYDSHERRISLLESRIDNLAKQINSLLLLVSKGNDMLDAMRKR